ncbi:MAG TPA: ATP synthase F0 subunit B [Vicinamibacterales bacterium]|nr:ATP synthase F0 subunit B [Vicinamibacterales bacterium]
MTVHSDKSETAPAARAPRREGYARLSAIVAGIVFLLVLSPDVLHAAERSEGNPVVQTIAKLLNFAVLVGVLVYYLRPPIAAYLVSRSTQIRADLVTAAETRRTATAQLEEIKRKLQSLPAELEAVKVQGAEDVKAEKVRIAQAAAAERERLLEQTRREIAMRLRIARRQLVDLAADLTVNAARERVVRSMTPEDHLRLVDRYTTQLQNTEAR